MLQDVGHYCGTSNHHHFAAPLLYEGARIYRGAKANEFDPSTLTLAPPEPSVSPTLADMKAAARPFVPRAYWGWWYPCGSACDNKID
jgi:hypothetical protein